MSELSLEHHHHRPQDTRSEKGEAQEERDYKKEELVGGKYLYRTERSGHVRIFDAPGEHEFLLAKATIEERKTFFDELYRATSERFLGVEVDFDRIAGTNIHINGIRSTESGIKVIGGLWCVVNGDDESPWLVINRVDAYEPGLTRLLMARLLKEFPAADLISGSLHETNRKAYFEKAKENGATHDECLYATPAYKYRAYVGFTETHSGQNQPVGLKESIHISCAPSGSEPPPQMRESDEDEPAYD